MQCISQTTHLHQTLIHYTPTVIDNYVPESPHATSLSGTLFMPLLFYLTMVNLRGKDLVSVVGISQFYVTINSIRKYRLNDNVLTMHLNKLNKILLTLPLPEVLLVDVHL